jgi:hypothetical protein
MDGSPRERRLPSPAGVGIVFRRQMRSRRAWRDLAWAGAELAGLLVIAALLQGTWAQAAEYSNDVPGFLLRWLTTGMVGAALLFPPCAAILGAGLCRRRPSSRRRSPPCSRA